MDLVSIVIIGQVLLLVILPLLVLPLIYYILILFQLTHHKVPMLVTMVAPSAVW